MSNKLLLPNKFKIVGWCILVPAAIVGLFLSFTNFESLPVKAKVFAVFSDEFFEKSRHFSIVETDITRTLVGVLFIVGAVLVSFSKEKCEDEFISNLRLSSLLWAVWVNYFLLLLSFLFIYGMGFFLVMTYNMFTVLIIFIVRFNYVLYKNSKTGSDEKQH